MPDPVAQPIPDALSAQLEVVREWRFYGEKLPFWALMSWAILSNVLSLVGLIGLLFFGRWARWMLAGLVICGLLIAPFTGMWVETAAEHAVHVWFSVFCFIAIVLAFFSPLAEEFKRKPKPLDDIAAVG